MSQISKQIVYFAAPFNQQMKAPFLTCTSFILLFFCACTNDPGKKKSGTAMKPISELFDSYYDEHNRLFPLAATANGDNRFNDVFPNDISEAYRDTLKQFFQRYLESLSAYDRSSLAENDQTSYDILKWDLEIALEGFRYNDHLMPVNQFWSPVLTFPQLGSGQGNQPFKAVKDYDNFIKRIDGFTTWCDTAIENMKKGMASGAVYPKVLMERVLPQLKAMIVTDVKESIFYLPLTSMPAGIDQADSIRLIAAIKKPSSKKLFPHMRRCTTSSGMSICLHAAALPGLVIFHRGKSITATSSGIGRRQT
jgi:uncharacterized protein (DUF885 family)